MLKNVFVASAARTPVGKFAGALKTFKAPQLGAAAIKAALERAKAPLADVDAVYFGNVIQANVGQLPARQAAIYAGLPVETEAVTINKVCASGLKSVAFAAQSIELGDNSVIVAGGMESMSNAPYYFPRGAQYGHVQALDSIIRDGLWDVYDDIHMGICAENTVKNYGITREDQDNYAQESYRRALAALESGVFNDEIVPLEYTARGKTVVVSEDEEPKSVNLARLGTLRPAFDKNGTVTAGNSSPLNDGASALVLASESAFSSYALSSPIARIISCADAATKPIDFTIAPSLAIPRALSRAGLEVKDIARWEINEAFAAVSLANNSILGLDPSIVNVNGGAVALGHAIGSSGSRILVSLIYGLKSGEKGVAAICNGGGGSTAVVVEKL
ncbi:Thiolase, N-terminal domain-containing protein [Kockiozyma suomiensis]|uniref:Thiolase, N-terminal domain-containing protein n=1 Tax=Kockiozyma suomiensis TaxID=1337062 RepID=UPI003343FE33